MLVHCDNHCSFGGCFPIPFSHHDPTGNNNRRNNDAASPKQLQYIQDLAHDAGVDLNAELRRLNLNNLEDLSRQQCSTLIDEIRGGHAKAA